MPICLADWNIGMDDAEAGALRRSGMPPDYYGGYGYACALNYEYMALGREPQVSRALATMQASHQIASCVEPLMALARATEDGGGEAQIIVAVTEAHLGIDQAR